MVIKFSIPINRGTSTNTTNQIIECMNTPELGKPLGELKKFNTPTGEVEIIKPFHNEGFVVNVIRILSPEQRSELLTDPDMVDIDAIVEMAFKEREINSTDMLSKNQF